MFKHYYYDRQNKIKSPSLPIWHYKFTIHWPFYCFITNFSFIISNFIYLFPQVIINFKHLLQSFVFFSLCLDSFIAHSSSIFSTSFHRVSTFSSEFLKFLDVQPSIWYDFFSRFRVRVFLSFTHCPFLHAIFDVDLLPLHCAMPTALTDFDFCS